MSIPIIPDTKDWTWVLERPCPDCGFDAATHSLSDLVGLLHDTAMVWSQVLRGVDVRERPDPQTWSPLEYACHVRDVHQVFADRLRLMLDRDAPTFAEWDQDLAAVRADYAGQDPAEVDVALIEAAGTIAGLYATVTQESAGRTGIRSNGSEFTVTSLGGYHLHDVVHHLHDVRWDSTTATVRAYDAYATAYAQGTSVMPDSVRGLIEEFASALPRGARVLEIGSGPGRDADLLECLGVTVRRTDVSTGFVELLRQQGVPADVLDPLHDDLSSPDGSYDGVWASACLLHVERADLPTVLARLAAVSVDGALLHVSLKEGDGEAWSTHGHVGAPRRFVYWREQPLRDALIGAGWAAQTLTRGQGRHGESWLEVRARRVATD